jgi:indolepyruvate ferredoxin oxidoreductase beta subunit
VVEGRLMIDFKDRTVELVPRQGIVVPRGVPHRPRAPERTLVLSSSARTLTTLERIAPGDGRLDDAALRQLVATFSREHQVLDMAALARRHGTVVSAVMLGAIAGSGLLPFARPHYEEAVRGDGVAYCAPATDGGAP